jgi:hypothetical protein
VSLNIHKSPVAWLHQAPKIGKYVIIFKLCKEDMQDLLRKEMVYKEREKKINKWDIIVLLLLIF